MYYSFRDNVYFVKGACRGCVYDFNTSRLYSVDHELSCLLNSICKEPRATGSYSDAEKSALDALAARGLLSITDEPRNNDIYELSEKKDIEFAWIEITTRCNLKCRHCYNESSPYRTSDMSLDQFKEVVEYLTASHIKKIQIIGGEPFCHRDLMKMLEFVVGKFDFIEVFTNGTLVTPEWVSYFKRNNIRIALSVYSYTDRIHDGVTGCHGSWEKTNQTIAWLKNGGVKYRVCNVLMKDVELGEQHTDLYALNPEKDVVRMSGRADLNLLSEELIKKKLITKETFRAPLHKAFAKRLISGHNCFSRNIYISAEMVVYPCVMERRLSHGTLSRKADFLLNRDILKLNKDQIKVCKNCEYRYACFDCRPDSISGDPFEKPWYCTYDPETGVWADSDVFINELECRLPSCTAP